MAEAKSTVVESGDAATVTGHTARSGAEKELRFEVADQKLTLRVGSQVVVFERDELARLEKMVRRAKQAV